MEQHPIPQDVTGFQFKLIGSMTVKQFGFVAAGIILAVILYYLPIKGILAFPIKILLIPLFGASGIIVAFVPIEGRPADVMATNFAKALFSPNQYVYRRQGRQFSFSKIADVKEQTTQQVAAEKTAHDARMQHTSDSRGARLNAFLLESSQSQIRNKLDEKELAFFKNISAISTPPPPMQTVPATQSAAAVSAPQTPIIQPIVAQTPPPPVAAQPPAPILQATPAAASVTPPQTSDELGKEEVLLEKELEAAKKEETQTPPAAASEAHKKVLELESKIQEIHQQKEQIDKELLQAKEQLATIQKQPVITPPAADTPQTTQAPAATPPAVAPAHNADLPHISDTPNVVVGIVRDPRGNILNNILVEIKDKDNSPVRAFKTNALGHFASATPLAPGTYTLELEDPKKLNTFDPIQLTINNQILLPLEIVSHDAREELRKQLFN